MRTAVDSSVLLAVFLGEPDASAWVNTLADARREGDLLVSETVFAEISPLFPALPALESRLRDLGIAFEPTNPDAAFLAGGIFARYRAEGGAREHMIPDFLIAAHAQVQASRLAAKDREIGRASCRERV